MKTSIALGVLVSMFVGTNVFASGNYRCVAQPTHFYSPRVTPLPGYGYGSSMAEARLAALRNCQFRSPYGAGANCVIVLCHKNVPNGFIPSESALPVEMQ